MDLKGKVVLVTGGARRIGKAISLGLAQRGAKIAIHYNRSGEAAKNTLKEITDAGGEGCLFQADLVKEEEVSKIISEVLSYYSRVDVLINNAAIFEEGSFFTTTSENWDRHFTINLKAPFILSQKFANQIPGDGEGKIIHLTDFRGVRPGVEHFAYAITKSALIAMTKSMAKVLAPCITVNSVALGAILPPEGSGEAYFEQKIKGIPLKRAGKPSDVVSAIRFLLEGADFMTGETLIIDGGEHL
jgi:NAD(P)-dependent dehydrogenase (short-subunit alcohol dehydrogenase family)